MAYADIADVALGDLIDETTFNQILANLRALQDRPSFSVVLDLGADKTITSAAPFADVDAALTGTLVVDVVSDVLLGFSGSLSRSVGGTSTVYFNITMDGVAIALNDGMIAQELLTSAAATPDHVSFTFLYSDVPAGSHTFNLQWKVIGTTPSARLYAGAGTSGADLHPNYWGKVL